MSMAQHNIENIKIVSIKTILKSIPETEAIYIFGSVAKGDYDDNSDIDIAFLPPNKVNSVSKFQIQEELAQELKCDVDLVNLNEASEVMQFQIIRNGIRLFAKSEDVSDQYEDKVFYLYVDLCELRQPIIDNIKESGSIYG